LMIFFFSSRRRHTRFSRDWSSDVCSSDLIGKDDHPAQRVEERVPVEGQFIGVHLWDNSLVIGIALVDQPTDEVDIGKLKKCVCRSEERRVGKECRSRWWAQQ